MTRRSANSGATAAALVLFAAALAHVAVAADGPTVAREMAVELAKPNADPGGRPLPVASHWANGFGRPSFTSDYQISLLEQGHHVMPTLPFPAPGATSYPEAGLPWIEKLAQWKTPLSLRAGQWESVLYEKDQPRDDPGKWRNLPADKSPLEIDRQGNLTTFLSPWGATEPWYEAGAYQTSSPAFKQLVDLYPDPPVVVLLSNNEARTLKPKMGIEASSQQFVDRFGTGRSADFQRQALVEGFLPKYAELLRGVRDGLPNEAWQKHALLVGYDAFGPPHFGRMEHWAVYSESTPQRIESAHLVWDGGAPSYYTHNWNASTDYRVWSPQVEANNWVFMLREAHREKPDFWFELSVWDGNNADTDKSPNPRKKDVYLKKGQIWSPQRYAGFVQYGMWLLTPRVVREFRGSALPRADYAADFEALVAAVDRVWADPVLTRFWRQGELVPNHACQHPYQLNIPERWQKVDRWYQLSTSLDPAQPWSNDTELPVFSLARVLGDPGRREWLVFAHSPLAPRKNVAIEVPSYGPATVDVSPGGDFYLIREADRTVTAVGR